MKTYFENAGNWKDVILYFCSCLHKIFLDWEIFVLIYGVLQEHILLVHYLKSQNLSLQLYLIDR